MRTLATQVKLRRLIRAFAEARERLASEPFERRRVGPVVDRLLELAGDVRESWRREASLRPLEAPLDAYVAGALRTLELAIAGLQQVGADLELLRDDLGPSGRPPEVCRRGLDAALAAHRHA